MYTQCLTADSELNLRCFDTSAHTNDSLLVEDRFATMPALAIVTPLSQSLSEEELHTAFEQAISDRLMIVNRQLSRVSGPLTHTYIQCGPVNTEPLGQASAIYSAVYCTAPQQQHHTVRTKDAWRRNVTYGCLALMFTLLGFDLMGLLMLHVH